MKSKRLRRRRKLKVPVNLIRIAREQGSKFGYNTGHGMGYHLGCCNSIMRLNQTNPQTIWNVHILFVSTGMGVPYSPIDEAVVKALQKSVRKLTVVKPTADIMRIVSKDRPDVMLVLNGMNFSESLVSQVRSAGILTAVWLTDDPYYTDVTTNIVKCYDFIFTLELSCVPLYQEIGCKQVHYLPFGNDFSNYYPRHTNTSYRYDILFVGSGYWNRIKFFDSIAPYLSTQNVMIAGWWWDRLQNYHLLSKKIRLGQWMTPQETTQYYNGAKIVINIHRSHEDDSYNQNSRQIPALSINPRSFEISGSGAFQLTDVRQDLQNHYVPGLEVATYNSPQELIEKIDYYLLNEGERGMIARRGFKRTVKDHTYEQRVIMLLSKILS